MTPLRRPRPSLRQRVAGGLMALLILLSIGLLLRSYSDISGAISQQQFETTSAAAQQATARARNTLLAVAGVIAVLGAIFLITTSRTITTEFERAYSRLEAELAERKRIEEETRDSAQRMRYRAAQLQTVADVARAIASVRELDQLLPAVASLISDRFGFYHVGIFLNDASGGYAVLQAANSEGGRRMLARGHQLPIGQVGIVGYVTGSGQPRIALDVGADAVFFNNPDLPLTRSELALPLKVRGSVIGALDAQSTQPSAFGEEDVSLLSTLADQVATAIENARLFSDVQRERELLEVANDAGRVLTAQVNLEAALDLALDLAPRLGAIHAYALVFGAGDEVYFRGTVPGLTDMTEAQAREFGRTIARSGLEKWVIENRQTVLIPDTRLDPRWYTAPEHEEEEPARCVISVPLFGPREGLAGVLAYTHPTPGRFDEKTARLVELIGRYLAIALDNVRLFSDVQRERERLQLANEIGQALVTEVNIERAVERALAVAPRLGGATHANVLILGPDESVYFKGTAPGLAELTGPAAEEFGRNIAARGLARWVLDNRQTALVTDSRTDPRWYTAPQHEAEEPARAVICLPLLGLRQGKTGTLTYTHPTPGHFDEQDARLAELVARYLAIALDNAWLVDETRRRAEREQTLNRLTVQLGRSLDLDTVLRTAVRELGQLPLVAEASVYLRLPEAPGD